MYKKYSVLGIIFLLLISVNVTAGNLILNLPGGGTYQVPLSGNLVIAPSGDITASSSLSSGSSGDGWCPAGGGVPGGPTVNLNANNASINAGAAVNLTWSTTNTAGTCTGTATLGGFNTSVTGWGNGLALNNAGGLALTLNTAGSYVFTLTCANAGGVTNYANRPVTVNAAVVDAGLPAFCSEVVVPGGRTRLTSFQNSPTSLRSDGNLEFALGATISALNYSPLMGNVFPARNITGTVPISNTNYVAFEFNTGTVTAGLPYGGSAYGSLNWASAQSNGGGNALVTISECPGAFTSYLVDGIAPGAAGAKCARTGVFNGLSFKVGNVAGSQCPLLPNTRYFVNIAFMDIDGLSTCGGATCHFSGSTQ